MPEPFPAESRGFGKKSFATTTGRTGGCGADNRSQQTGRIPEDRPESRRRHLQDSNRRKVVNIANRGKGEKKKLTCQGVEIVNEELQETKRSSRGRREG